jgi:hypothetical protein
MGSAISSFGRATRGNFPNSHDGREFDALEPLFLHLTGERNVELNWL